MADDATVALQRKEELRESIIYGVKGFFAGSLPALGAAYYAQMNSLMFRRWPTSVKSALVLMPGIAIGWTMSENSTLFFERQRLNRLSSIKMPMNADEENNLASHRPRSLIDKFLAHRYEAIAGVWGITMLATGAYLWGRRGLPRSQKVIYARIIAQGVTVASIFGLGFVSTLDVDDNESTVEKVSQMHFNQVVYGAPTPTDRQAV